MKGMTTTVMMAIVTISLSAQEIRNLRFDVGYGIAPQLTGQGRAMRGFHVIAAARVSGVELSLHYSGRKSGAHEYGFAHEENASTVSVQAGITARTSHARFTISGGLGTFRSRTRVQGYFTYAAVPFDRTEVVTRFAVPVDIRMCWALSRGYGFGFAVFGAYVKDYSYAGYQIFLRVEV